MRDLTEKQFRAALLRNGMEVHGGPYVCVEPGTKIRFHNWEGMNRRAQLAWLLNEQKIERDRRRRVVAFTAAVGGLPDGCTLAFHPESGVPRLTVTDEPTIIQTAALLRTWHANCVACGHKRGLHLDDGCELCGCAPYVGLGFEVGR